MIKLMRGDCIERMREIPDGSVDLVLTDPPYGVTRLKWDSVIPLDLMWFEINRIAKPESAILMFCSQPFTSLLIMSNINNFKYCWTWKRTKLSNFLNAKKQPLRNTESISVFYRKQCRYNPQMTLGSPYSVKSTGEIASSVYGTLKSIDRENNGTRHPTQVLEFGSVHNVGSHHPTQKPVDLLRYLVRTYTNAGDTVLDFTMGSGSTGVACVREGRDFIGIEMDTDYFEAAMTRIHESND